jgi:serine/threonine-protein kinase
VIGTALDHYRITAALGAGGMGEVWRATDEKLGREVAIKVLPEEFAEDPDRMKRFQREAKVLASLNHPNIAHLYGLETAATRPAAETADPLGLRTDEGRVDEKSEIRNPKSEMTAADTAAAVPVTFLVMELVEGEDLSERIKRGPIPVAEAIPIALQITAALEAAHEAGTVHRDLKPANIKITDDGTVKVLDFGLAKVRESETGDSSLSLSPTVTRHATVDGVILGTAAYMSPEQARGKKVDRRADIWAFGVVLWEMLTGRKLFEGETVTDVLADVLRADIDLEVLHEGTPSAVRRLLRRCLERDPRSRLRDIGDARLELSDSNEIETVQISGEGSIRAVPRWIWGVSLAAIAAALMAGVAAFHLARSSTSEPVRRFDVSADDVHVGRSRLPSISPDGSKALWSAYDSLWVRDFSEFEAVKLPDTEGAQYPFWSPEGRFVGFVRNDRVWRVDVSHGSTVSIGSIPPGSMTGSGAAVWGPDGRILIAGSHQAGLFSLSELGGEASILVPLNEETEADFHHVAYLPESRGLVVSVHGQADAGFTLELITETERKVLFGGAGLVVGSPIYSPTGHLLFERWDTTPGIWALPFSLARLEVDGPPFLAVPDARTPSLGRDGTLLYLREGLWETRKVGWVEPSGDVEWVLDETGPYGGVSLSPDASKVLFHVQQAGGPALWIHDLERDITTKLTHSEGISGAPKWMPDGRRIVFTSDRAGKGWDLFLMAADGSGEPVMVYDSDAYSWPTAVTSDGRFVIFDKISRANQQDILKLDLENQSVDVVAGSRFWEGNGAVSPDDGWLAYESDETGRKEVYLRPLASDTGRVQVSDGGGELPAWSKQGDRLFFRQDDRIMVVEVDLTGPEAALGRQDTFVAGVAAGRSTTAAADVFDVSDDGSRLLMSLRDPDVNSGAHLGAVFGFLDELRQMARDAER